MILKKICYNSWIIPFEQNHRKRKETSEHWTCNNKEKKCYLLSEPNYRATKILSKNLLAIEMKKKQQQIFIPRPVYLGSSALELCKIVMYEFWYDYIKPKYHQKNKIKLYGDSQFHFLCKNGRCLRRHCKRCWKKAWYFKL